MRLSSGILCALAAFVATGCATRDVTFKTTPKAAVSLVDPADLDSAGELVGETPLTLPLSKVGKRVVKLSRPGMQTAYILVAETAGAKTVAAVKLREDAGSALASKSGAGTTDVHTTMNRASRLMLKAYQALTMRKFTVADELAKQASEIDPNLAAPFVLRGMAQMRLGQRDGARANFEKAKGLDPEDRDLDTLAKSAR